MEAIQTGLHSEEYFAFASGFDDTRYIDLKFNQYVGVVERSGYLVKVSVAKKQLAEEEARRRAETAARLEQAAGGAGSHVNADGGGAPTVYEIPASGKGGGTVHEPPAPEAPKNKRST